MPSSTPQNPHLIPGGSLPPGQALTPLLVPNCFKHGLNPADFQRMAWRHLGLSREWGWKQNALCKEDEGLLVRMRGAHVWFYQGAGGGVWRGSWVLVSVWAGTEATQRHLKHPFIRTHDHQTCCLYGFLWGKTHPSRAFGLARTEQDQA